MSRTPRVSPSSGKLDSIADDIYLARGRLTRGARPALGHSSIRVHPGALANRLSWPRHLRLLILQDGPVEDIVVLVACVNGWAHRDGGSICAICVPIAYEDQNLLQAVRLDSAQQPLPRCWTVIYARLSAHSSSRQAAAHSSEAQTSDEQNLLD